MSKSVLWFVRWFFCFERLGPRPPYADKVGAVAPAPTRKRKRGRRDT